MSYSHFHNLRSDFLTKKQKNTGIYIHWPFCEAKCPYCDFNSHVQHRNHGSTNEHIDAIITSLNYTKQHIADKATINTIFFGGGTPSLIPPNQIERILCCIHRLWPVNENVEITLEANPSSSEQNHFKDYHSLGVNRLSIGVQALCNNDLKTLGRWHSKETALKTIEIAKSIFDEFSFDLIHTRFGQTLKDWEKELQFALSLAKNHISLYELTIEPETVFGAQYKKGLLKNVDENLASDFFTLTRDICYANNFNAYEISNFCRNNKVSRHNMNYWQSGDYIGIGAGAHGRLWSKHLSNKDSLKRHQIENEKNPKYYLQNIYDHHHAFTVNSYLNTHEILQECLLMGLRLKQGISLDDYTIITGKPLNKEYNQWLIDNKFALFCNEEKNFALTEKGILITNHIIDKIISNNMS